MILGLGTDIINLARFEAFLARFPSRGPTRLFTESERQRAAQLRAPLNFYAKRFAAKEAFVKALGTGMRGGISWQDISVSNLPSGQPVLKATGVAARHLDRMIPDGYRAVVHVSLSDTADLAQATVLITAVPV